MDGWPRNQPVTTLAESGKQTQTAGSTGTLLSRRVTEERGNYLVAFLQWLALLPTEPYNSYCMPRVLPRHEA